MLLHKTSGSGYLTGVTAKGVLLSGDVQSGILENLVVSKSLILGAHVS